MTQVTASAFRNILLIQLGDIGDVVLTTPAIRAIRETLPEARVSILVFKPYGNLLAADPHLHEVIETSRVRGPFLRKLREYAAFVRSLRQRHYDLVIDLRTGDRGALLSLLSGATVRAGYCGDNTPFWRKLVYTKALNELVIAPPPVHPGADQSLRILRELGFDTADSIPRLYVAGSDLARAQQLLSGAGLSAGSIITVNPYSRWKYKEWSDRKWGELIDRLWERHRLPAVLIGAPEEMAACAEITKGREDHTHNLAGKTSLGELAALISLSALHLGVDSAAPHIAAALGTPTVTLHGPSDWRGWSVVDKLHRIAVARMECVPCNDRGCNNTGRSLCLEQLDVEIVTSIIEQVLTHPAPTGSHVD